MPSRSNTPNWEAPEFFFNASDQAEEWKSFFTRAIDFLEALDIDPDVENQGKRGGIKLKWYLREKTAKLSRPSLTAKPSCLMPSRPLS